MRLKDKVAIVTGGGRGIGEGISKRLAHEGAKIVIAQRDLASADVVMKTLVEAGGDGLVIQTDVSQPESVKTMVAKTLAKYGKIDILVNNAGIAGTLGGFLDLSYENWQRVIGVNLTGVYLCSQAAAQQMVEQGIQGRIISIGSVNGFIAQKDAAAYVASKGGVLMLTKAMAVDLAQYGILVNCIAPGSIRVGRNTAYYDSEPFQALFQKGVPLGHPGLPGDVAGAVAFLASDDAAFITGTNLVIDGGFTSYFRIE